MSPDQANILSVINYERNHMYRISTNYLVDSLATKTCFDYFSEVLKNTDNQKQKSNQGLVGFLQEINLVPYGLVFLCDQQVYIIINRA